MKIFFSLAKVLLILPLLFCCSNESEGNQENDLKELNSLKKEIQLLANSGNCTDIANCDYLAFGSKPCGGPWSYLVYSKTIDVVLLKQKVSNYNSKENAFNLKWGIISDCSLALPPTGFSCVDGKCVAIY